MTFIKKENRPVFTTELEVTFWRLAYGLIGSQVAVCPAARIVLVSVGRPHTFRRWESSVKEFGLSLILKAIPWNYPKYFIREPGDEHVGKYYRKFTFTPSRGYGRDDLLYGRTGQYLVTDID